MRDSVRRIAASLGVVLATVLLAASLARAVEETREFGRFGTIHLYHAAARPAQVVLFVSGDGGWNEGVVDMARDLAGMDALVVGVDIIHYLKALEASGEACLYPASDFEALSQYVQKELAYPAYVTPVLVGYSSGATLVYAMLAQAPATTFRGAISLGFCPDLPLTRPMCRGSGLTWGPGPHGKGYSFEPATHLETPWIALQGTIDQVCDPASTAAFVGKVPGARVVMLPKVGHGYAVPKNWLPQFREAYRTVLAAPSADPTRQMTEPARAPGAPADPSEGAAAGAAPAGDPGDPGDLPLVEVPATATSGPALAIHFTGDGGWGVTDKGIARELAAAGVPVVGWNSLRYFWQRRDPDEATRDLERVMRHYLASWEKQKVILIGYSFGADVVPFLFNRLPADLQTRVPVIVLIGPSADASFEFRLGEWFGRRGESIAYPVAPEIARMSGAKLFCFCGEDDKEAICAQLDPAHVTSVTLSGGHRIGDRFDSIVQRILGALP